jgi:hypothetical protein
MNLITLTLGIVAEAIVAGPKNADGGRTISIAIAPGQTRGQGIGHCVLTFATATELDRLRAALDAK